MNETPERTSTCDVCGQVFVVKGKRGSPPAICDPCKLATGVRIR